MVVVVHREVTRREVGTEETWGPCSSCCRILRQRSSRVRYHCPCNLNPITCRCNPRLSFSARCRVLVGVERRRPLVGVLQWGGGGVGWEDRGQGRWEERGRDNGDRWRGEDPRGDGRGRGLGMDGPGRGPMRRPLPPNPLPPAMWGAASGGFSPMGGPSPGGFGPPTEAVLNVPAHLTGMIIGKAGIVIKGLRQEVCVHACMHRASQQCALSRRVLCLCILVLSCLSLPAFPPRQTNLPTHVTAVLRNPLRV